MNGIAGRVDVVIGGVRRTLACDMNAATVLYEKYGEHWTLWLIERFVGRPVDLPGGGKGRKVESMTLAEKIDVLYALLAADREDSGVVEDAKTLRRSIGAGDWMTIYEEMHRSVTASFGIPGEAYGVVAGAAGEPRGSERAAMGGTGTKR